MRDMLVNRENYELFVLDFLDGKLSEGNSELFARFLNDHPDLMEEVMNIEQMRLLPGDITCPEKDMLKKSIKETFVDISDNNFGDYCIAYLEGDLTSSETKNFEEYLEENPHKRVVLESYRKAFLKPDMSIEFISKSKLKKLTINQKRIRIISSFSSAAAILILAILLVKPGFHSLRRLITIRDQSVNSQNEITSVNNNLQGDERDLPDKFYKSDIRKQNNVNNLQQISTVRPKEAVIITGDEEILQKDLTAYERIELNRLSSLQVYIEVQAHQLPELLLTTKHSNSGISEKYQTVFEFAGESLKEGLIQKTVFKQEDHLTFWDVADAGFNGLDRISEGTFALNRKTDENGSIKRISVETPVIGLTLPVKGNKNSR